MNMSKTDKYQTTRKHNKWWTVWIILGTYCTYNTCYIQCTMKMALSTVQIQSTGKRIWAIYLYLLHLCLIEVHRHFQIYWSHIAIYDTQMSYRCWHISKESWQALTYESTLTVQKPGTSTLLYRWRIQICRKIQISVQPQAIIWATVGSWLI